MIARTAPAAAPARTFAAAFPMGDAFAARAVLVIARVVRFAVAVVRLLAIAMRAAVFFVFVFRFVRVDAMNLSL
jgi:hypothetical protein